jgi:hypothetical protein
MPEQYLNSTQHSVSWFYKTHQAGELELNPPFQRNPVWTDSQKSYLIDTILRGYPIPELYMQEYPSADGQERHVVVDGQQRIRACLEFVEGRYVITDTDTEAWRNLSFDDLSEAQKKTVFGYNFQVRLLPEMPEVELRAMFSRLNRNVIALNSQELRHATYWGPFIKTMEQIADEDTWTEFGVFTPNDVRRMLDVEYISELAVAVLHGIQNKKDSLERWYAAYEVEFEDKGTVEEAFQTVTGELAQVLPALRVSRWHKKSDFYTLFLFFADVRDHLPLSREQREAVREALLGFGDRVSALLRDDEALEHGEGPERTYALNVSRAASDLQSRRKRAESLCEVLASCIER